MEWTTPRDSLIPTKINFKNLYFKPKVDDLDRNKILKKVNYTCRTCGGTYKAYLILTYVLKDNCYDMYCGACHIITHLNIGLPKGIDLYCSKMSQLDIIKKTVDYIITNQQIPNPKHIDPLIEQSPISLFEYINILDNISNGEFADYKIFFNENYNINFITYNYGAINPFLDGDNNDNMDNEKKIITLKLPVHELSDGERNLVNSLFIQ